jgi:hypothetical protein
MELLYTACAIPQEDGSRVDGLPGGEWVDAGAGDGAIESVCRKERRDINVVTVERRAVAIQLSRRHGDLRLRRRIHGDWTDKKRPSMRRPRAVVVVMNSAFSLTVDFIDAAFRNCPKAWVWSLQRQSWGAPKKSRRAWLLDHWPEYKLQVNKRPSFTGDGKTDPAEYIWYGWSPTGRNRKYARFEGPCNEHSTGLMATETK